MNKKNYLIILGIAIAVATIGAIFFAGRFAGEKHNESDKDKYDKGDSPDYVSYESVSMDEAKAAFSRKGDYIIVDVRRADEFAEGHIPDAINIPNESIEDEPAELPDKEQTIYVYCRSGRRSKEAAQKLVELGYTSIIECGGILDWTGEIENNSH